MNEESIFAEACTKKTPVERAAYLDSACGTDQALRSRIDELLAAHAHPDAFLEEPPPGVERDIEQTLAHTPSRLGKGTRIGRYKLLEEIGEGGMGTVWVAEQTEPVRRKVALKLVKAGMDSAQVVARFNAERQALAVMDHPNIAKVYDGGLTEQGRPYFVMEYVKGVPLTEYCDQAKLSLRERLQLFVPVCQAVQHAHQKGIIHRDLKPSNILACLYDGHPVPKVIDFGLAKAMHQPLTEQTLHTAHGMMLGTPMYMSPEQAEFNNLDVDTRTDVYSLGVILYELLTGTTPLEKQQLKEAAMNEILRLIKEVEPPKPSTRLSGSTSLPSLAAQRSLDAAQLRRSVRGDLDWIVMKALDKERSRRYETANGLARDIERFLNEEAVEACPPSAVYRLRKFARKNRTLISTVAAFVLLLIVGMTISIVQARWEFAAREKAVEAEHQAKEAEADALTAQSIAQQESRKAHAQLYLTETLLAWDSYNKGNIREARRLVEKHLNSPWKSLEWTILNRELLSIDSPLVTTNLTLPKLRAARDRDLVVIEDTQTQQSIIFENGKSLPPGLGKSHPSHLLQKTISSGGRFIAGFDTAKNLSVSDRDTSEVFSVRCVGMKPNQAVLSPNEMEFSIACKDASKEIRLVNWKTGTELHRWSPSELFPDDRSRVHPIDNPALKVSNRGIGGIFKFAKDGSLLLSSDFDGWLYVWNSMNGDLVQLWEHYSNLHDADVSPDGTIVATCHLMSPNEIDLWSLETGKLHGRLVGHNGMIHSVVFLRNGTLASASRDNTIRIWDVNTLRELHALRGHSTNLVSLCATNAGRYLYSASIDGEVRRWDMARLDEQGDLTALHRYQVSDMATTHDGKRLISAQMWRPEVQVWDLESGTTTKPLVFPEPVYSVDVSPSNWLATGNKVGVVYLRDLNAPKKKPIQLRSKMKNWVQGLAFSPDGRYLAASDTDGNGSEFHVVVWDLVNFDLNTSNGIKPVFLHEIEEKGKYVSSLSWSPDGKYLAGGGTIGVCQWDLINWKRQDSPRVDPVSCVAWSPDGSKLASCGGEGKVRLWSRATGEVRDFHHAHAGRVWEVAFSSDGSTIISSSGDETVGIWDVEAGKLRASLPGHIDGAKSLTLTRDGKRLITGGLWDGKIRVWRLE